VKTHWTRGLEAPSLVFLRDMSGRGGESRYGFIERQISVPKLRWNVQDGTHHAIIEEWVVMQSVHQFRSVRAGSR
jgi:hypothetical protein